MKVALAQIAPVLLDRERTLAKVTDAVQEAGRGGASLVVFGETLVPGYPAWTARTDGARWDAPDQKALHALYLDQAVDLSRDHLAPVRAAAREHGITVCLGIAEREHHSIFASARRDTSRRPGGTSTTTSDRTAALATGPPPNSRRPARPPAPLRSASGRAGRRLPNPSHSHSAWTRFPGPVSVSRVKR